MGSAGELITRRTLDRLPDGTGYAPGQIEARIIDPHPHRDRADLAAILTYVDAEGRAASVTCMRYRDRGWRSVVLHRASLKTIERATVVGCPPLDGDLLAAVERAAEGRSAFPFETPSADEREIRALAHRLIDEIRA